MLFYSCRWNADKCADCGFCSESIFCSGLGKLYVRICEHGCVDCQACYFGCPYQAVERLPDVSARGEVGITVDGEGYCVPERITLKKALEFLGYKFSKFPEDSSFFAPCETGGCYACSVIVDGKLKPACTTSVKNGIIVQTEVPEEQLPLRRVSGYQPHSVGGVGTPWWIKKSGQRYIEVACFAHGCNLRCPQCQNFTITYNNVKAPSTPTETAEVVTEYRSRYGVNRLAISGGEPTLNRRWLVEYFRELRRLNTDPKARLHLDTNATILTPDYIDSLVEAGMTDIGPDLKGLRLETFMKITGIADRDLATRYQKNSWRIVKYIVDKYYPEKLFIGVGIPYNKYFISLEEIREFGEKIFGINAGIQVCLLDYFPTFRRLDMRRPTMDEMMKAWNLLKESGLKTVLAQTSMGHIGP